MQQINQIKDKGKGHVVNNAAIFDKIEAQQAIMDKFLQVRPDEDMEIHMAAMSAATKFERWLDQRVQKLNKYNNAFYNNILDIMNEILANLDV